MRELIAAYDARDAAFDSAASSDIALELALIDQLLVPRTCASSWVQVLAEVLLQATDLPGGEDGTAGVSLEAGATCASHACAPADPLAGRQRDAVVSSSSTSSQS